MLNAANISRHLLFFLIPHKKNPIGCNPKIERQGKTETGVLFLFVIKKSDSKHTVKIPAFSLILDLIVGDTVCFSY